MIMRVEIVTVVLLTVVVVVALVVPVVLLIGLLCSFRGASAKDRVVLFQAFAQAMQQMVSSISRRKPRSGDRA